MLRIVEFSYKPNTAATNRLLSFLTNIPSRQQICLYFLTPDENFSKWDEAPQNIHVTYCWCHYPKLFWRSKMLKYLMFRNVLNFVYKQLHEGDIVYCYGVPSYIRKIRKPHVKFYAERT